ncbi:gluconokinase [Kitasatospora sp. NPDC088346]|uniref:gluconokinase n=1 Tax=Kitasatospora sp. NPDC088346 TaxID=3364073 RepID=UPI003807A2E7
MASDAAPTVVLVMGVSGSGKTTVGTALARRRGVPFVEGDGLHPPANIAKMASGRPLDDEDRAPWLRGVAGLIRAATRTGTGAVVSCSALKREYRDRFRAAGPGVWFLYLALDREVAHERVVHRVGHFMPVALLGSQYDTLEPLEPDEPGLTVDARAEPPTLLASAQAAIARSEAARRV